MTGGRNTDDVHLDFLLGSVRRKSRRSSKTPKNSLPASREGTIGNYSPEATARWNRAREEISRELSSRPSGGDLWPLAMTSMGMRQFGVGNDSEFKATTTAQPSSEDLSSSHCGSKLNLLEAGSLHYSNQSCHLLPTTSSTHQQPKSAETRFNGTPQLSPVTSNHQHHLPRSGGAPTSSSMVANTDQASNTADFRKQRAVMKKDLQRKFGTKDTHDRTRCNWSFVFDPAGRLCYYWSMVVSFAFLYNFWVIIFRFSFAEITLDTLLIWFSLDYLMDLIYLLDIIFHFRTGYLEDGVLQTDSTKLRQHYMNSTTFYVDCLCLLPLDFLYLSLGFKSILRIFRLVKVYQFWAFMDRSERHTNYPNLLRFVSLIHYLLLVFHWNACLFHLLHYSTGFGYESHSEAGSPWDASRYPVPGDSFMTYLKSVYWTVLAMTTIGGLPSPKTRSEFLYVIFELVIGLITFATVLGYIANIVTNVSAARKDFQAKLDGVKTYMRLRRVPNSLQNKVIKWFDYLWLTQKSSDEEKAVSCLPDKLKGEIAIHVHLDTLKRVEIFQNTEAGFLCELVLRLRPVLFSPGDYICRKGEVGKEMYICARGRLEVVVDDGKTVLATLKAGSYFGEISILNMGTAGNRRTASVRSVGYSDLFVLSKKDMWDVLKDYPAARVRLEAIAVKRLEKYKKAPLEKAALPRSESTPGLVESRGKVPLEEMWVSPLPLYSQDKSSTATESAGKRDGSRRGSEMSTRSQSVADKDTIAIVSTSSQPIGAHGYNNEAYKHNRPLKQLVVTAGNGGGHRFHHHHGHHHQYPSVSGQGPSSNTHHVLQFHDHHERIQYPQSGEVVQQHSAHQSFQRQVTAGSIGSSNSTVTSAGQIPELQQGSRISGDAAGSAMAASAAAAANQLVEDQKKEELLLEIHRLRERIKCLETDNASMHTKLSKAQKDVSQRLAEIEMQINDDDYSFDPTSQSPEDDEEEDEINRESFI